MRYINVFDRVERDWENLRPSEQKVAQLVRDMPRDMISSSIATVARQAGVSEPSVMRFCTVIGFKGFQDFKLSLAQSLARDVSYLPENIDKDDDVATSGPKVCSHAMGAIGTLRDDLDWVAVERAVDAIAVARRVEFHGAGASGVVAMDAQHKFFRFGMPVSAHIDGHMQVMSTASLERGDVVVSFSYTGQARDVVRAARLATEQGATVIAVTAAGSPLAQAATLVVALPEIEDTDIYTPMVSRLMQLVVVDVLATGVALRLGPRVVDHLHRVKESVIPLRVIDDDTGADDDVAHAG